MLAHNMRVTELRDGAHGANAIAFRYTGDTAAQGDITEYACDRPGKTPDVWDWLFKQDLSQRQSSLPWARWPGN